MHISVVGLSHRTAPVEIRERLSIPEQTMETSLQSLRGNEQVLEASILSTCNRLEIYTLVRNPDLGVSAVSDFLSSHSGLETGELTPHLFSYHHEDAVDHLMRVAAGLDSLVLGEGQILSQVKKMMRLGQEHKSLGPILNRLLTQAVTTGKRVRSETNLGTGAVSISSAAVELAQLKLGQSRGLDQLVTLESEQIAVVGAGRMSRLLLQHLQAKGASGVVLLNRTVERAEQLSADFPDLPVQCRPLTDLDQYLSTCSLLFTSNAADDPIFDAARLAPQNRRSKLRLIDIGVPRNIAADAADVTALNPTMLTTFKRSLPVTRKPVRPWLGRQSSCFSRKRSSSSSGGTALRPCRPSTSCVPRWSRSVLRNSRKPSAEWALTSQLGNARLSRL